MSAATLVDSNVFIDYLRDVSEAVEFLESQSERPAAFVISFMELMVGARNRREEDRIIALDKTVRVLPVNLVIARRAGEFFKHYGPSHATDHLDALIAATAEHHGLSLATLNTKHFPMFPKLKRAY